MLRLQRVGHYNVRATGVEAWMEQWMGGGGLVLREGEWTNQLYSFRICKLPSSDRPLALHCRQCGEILSQSVGSGVNAAVGPNVGAHLRSLRVKSMSTWFRSTSNGCS